jgi:hypothetical protein
MNPVDHVRYPVTLQTLLVLTMSSNSPTVVVTINISAKLPPSQDTLLKVKRPVSLLLGEQVCFVVHKRQRTRWFVGSLELECVVECVVLHVSLLSRSDGD